MTVSDVSVVLCTYNGERFLPELLDSLLRQTRLPAELIWRDDRSTDSTTEIATDFSKHAPFPVDLAVNPTNLGPMQNFGVAMSLANGSYVAPCDQDDVWLPNKLELLAGHFSRPEIKLVYSDSLIVDSDLASTDQSFLEQRGTVHEKKDSLEHLMFQNTVSGCVSMFDAGLLSIALPIPESAIMHDWWLTLVAAAVGEVHHVPGYTTLYRQHDANVLGSPARFSPANLRASGLPFHVWRKAGDSFTRSANQALALQQRLHDRNIDTPEILNELSHYLRGSRSDALKLFSQAGVQRGEFLRNLYFLIGLLAYRPDDLLGDD